MAKESGKIRRLARRRRGGRKKLYGTAERPRLCVYRSTNHIYAQIIDDAQGKTIAAASSPALKIAGGNVESAGKVGAALAENARKAGVEAVAFDRNGRLYHGRIKALAEAARKGGLQF